MARFKKIAKTVFTIMAVVPFSLIGVLVVATVSKPGLKESISEEVKYHEVTHPVPSPTKITDGGTVVIERSEHKISQLTQQGCLVVGKPCETPNGKRVGVWGETVFKRSPS